jgi:hypothetical protein
MSLECIETFLSSTTIAAHAGHDYVAEDVGCIFIRLSHWSKYASPVQRWCEPLVHDNFVNGSTHSQKNHRNPVFDRCGVPRVVALPQK